MRKCELCGGPMERCDAAGRPIHRKTRRKIFICRNHSKAVMVEDPGYEGEDETRLRKRCALPSCNRLPKRDATHPWRRYCSSRHRLRGWRQRKRMEQGLDGGSEERPVIAAKL